MNPFSSKSRIFVTCNKWLSPYLKMEVEALGFTPKETVATGVFLEGTLTDCIRLNLNLRCASQVMYSLKRFACFDPDGLYRNASQVPWEELIPANGYFSVTSNVFHDTIRTDMFANVRVKDAIVDRMRNNTGQRPDSGPLLDKTVVYLFWKNNQAELFLDSSGETLAKHGYRKIPGKAPMLEALAAATLLATRWDRRSPLVNPMCGSGTLAIEAALIATNRAPGLLRNNYAFMHVIGYDSSLYENEMQRTREAVRELPELKIYASDISPDAINVTRINAAMAGVEQYLELYLGDFALTPVPELAGGIVIFNPEYGERLGEESALQETYKRIGDFLKQRCKGYTGYIFTGNLELAKKIGLKASRRIEFFNGKIDCRLLEYELYAGTKRSDIKT